MPEKEYMAQRVIEISKSVRNIEEFEKVLNENMILFYKRNGKLTGVWNLKKTRKYRFKGLGLDPLTIGMEKTRSFQKERNQTMRRNIDR